MSPRSHSMVRDSARDRAHVPGWWPSIVSMCVQIVPLDPLPQKSNCPLDKNSSFPALFRLRVSYSTVTPLLRPSTPPPAPQMQLLTPTSDLITLTTISQARLSLYTINAGRHHIRFAQMWAFLHPASMGFALRLCSLDPVISLKKKKKKSKGMREKNVIGIHVPYVDEFFLFRKIHCEAFWMWKVGPGAHEMQGGK